MFSNDRTDEVVLAAERVSVGYGAAPVLCDVSLALGRGEMVALLGRNGAGKSTLLRLLSGVLTPSRGTVCLDGVPLARLGHRQVARRQAVVPQEVHVPFAFTVREVVALGRTAHVPFLHGESARDRHAVERALRLLALEPLAARPYNSLSAGERQRAVLAMALAQEPRVLLLDEPTVHLDLAHQLSVLELVRGQNRSEGLAVLAAIHDLNLATLLFDRLVLLKDGHIIADGPPEAVVTAEAVRDVFGTAVAVYHHPTAGVPQITLLPSGPPSV
jgi:iron complex transport system ATP-binding protein